MNYAIRNTIILLITVLVTGFGGWGVIHWFQSDQIEYLKEDNERLATELAAYESTAADYDQVVEQYVEFRYQVEYHPKAFFPTSSVSDVYDYISRLNRGQAFTELNFNYQDSTLNDQYGEITTSVNGEGTYRNLLNFISRIETGRPLHKISSIQIQAVNELESLSYVTFNMTLKTLYARLPDMTRATLVENTATRAVSRNPFFPLIHAVRPVEEGEINIENSRVIALGQENAYIIDQDGLLRTLSVGGDVYLGVLERINTDSGTAVFRLNRGGIVDRVTKQIRE